MRLYDTTQKKVVDFDKPTNETVTIYSCGPTVYSEPHIGNMASYIYWDLLDTALKQSGHYNINHIINITDVGHLVSDADDGEDKMEKAASKFKKTAREIADYYTNFFKDELRSMAIHQLINLERATDYIPSIIVAVDALVRKGYTYETDDGIYFDTSKYPDYGKLFGINLDGLQAGKRVDMGEKKNPTDFAIWKWSKPDEHREQEWEFNGRMGYPGWHIECSTIIYQKLGKTIDIHTGGIEHITVHHTNEDAQAVALTGRHLAEHWMHSNHVMFNGKKMSKSEGEVLTVRELVENYGYDPMDFKMWVLSGHYRSARNFTFDALDGARKRRINWKNRMNQAGPGELHQKLIEGVVNSITNDINSAEAFAFIDSFKEMNWQDWDFVENVFGLDLKECYRLPNHVERLLRRYQDARDEKDYARADRLKILIEHEAPIKVWTVKNKHPDYGPAEYVRYDYTF